jgi:hypothetical protein
MSGRQRQRRWQCALLTRDPRGLQRFRISLVRGPLQLRSETEAVGQGEGSAGYPRAMPGNFPCRQARDTDVSFQVADVGGASGAARSAGPEPDQWIALVPEWERMSAWLARTVDASTRAWLVDSGGWVLADSAHQGAAGR